MLFLDLSGIDALDSQRFEQPLHVRIHLGVTEAGEGEDGRIKSAIGIGSLLADGIDCQAVSTVEGSSGVALIVVDDNSQNAIVIVAGANGALTPALIDQFEAVLHAARTWDLIATYSYTDSEVLEGTIAGKNLPSVPEHMASLWSQHRFSIGEMTGFRGGFGVRYIGTSWDGTDTLATPSQTLVDAMVGYDVGAWSFALNVNNLTDKTYYTTCLARGDCFVGNRRTVVGTASYRF